VPPGIFLLMVMGRMPASSSMFARSMGFVRFLGALRRRGAPKAIWRARAPVILALSNLVSFGGPMSSWFSVVTSGLHQAELVLDDSR